MDAHITLGQLTHLLRKSLGSAMDAERAAKGEGYGSSTGDDRTLHTFRHTPLPVDGKAGDPLDALIG